MELSELFTDREKDELNRFVNNSVMYEAVKKVILSAVYFEGTIQKTGLPKPLENFALAFAAGAMGKLTYKEMGQKLETSLIAVQLLNDGFARLHKFNKKEKKQEVERSNPGR